MKKMFLVLMTLVLSVYLVSCNTGIKENEIHVGVAFYPMKDILELIRDDLKEEGYELVIKEFTDYQVPNNLLKEKELDANMIQHQYFLEEFNKANKSNLVIVNPIYHATFALYSKDFDINKDYAGNELDLIKEGSNITLPDDSTNISRALYLLGQVGLLTFKDNKKLNLTEEDILDNPKKLTFNEKVPLTSLAQKYTETGLAVMYPTYAKGLKLEGDAERLYVEKTDDVTNNYAISLASRNDNKDSAKIKALIKHINSDKVREFLIENYGWASSPAF